MLVYRVCSENEINYIVNNKNFNNIGRNIYCGLYGKTLANTHKYDELGYYMHFFKEYSSIYLLECNVGEYICAYNISLCLLNNYCGRGIYNVLVNGLPESFEVFEYAIPSKLISVEYLVSIEKITMKFGNAPKRKCMEKYCAPIIYNYD